MKKNWSLSYNKMDLERSKRVAETIEDMKKRQKEKYTNDTHNNKPQSRGRRAIHK